MFCFLWQHAEQSRPSTTLTGVILSPEPQQMNNDSVPDSSITESPFSYKERSDTTGLESSFSPLMTSQELNDLPEIDERYLFVTFIYKYNNVLQ